MRMIPVIMLVLLIHFGTSMHGQKPAPPPSPKPVSTPPPPPPPPPPRPYVKDKVKNDVPGDAGGAPSGFQLLKVQIAGNYKLGMTRAEYDSLAKKDFYIKTTRNNYKLLQWPSFSTNKLISLQFSTYTEDSTDFKDVLAMYKERLGEPVEKVSKDTIINFPSQIDTLLNGEYRVEEIMLTWNYRYYDLVLYTIMIDMNNNTRKSNLRLIYKGNEKYLEILQNIVRKDD